MELGKSLAGRVRDVGYGEDKGQRDPGGTPVPLCIRNVPVDISLPHDLECFGHRCDRSLYHTRQIEALLLCLKESITGLPVSVRPCVDEAMTQPKDATLVCLMHSQAPQNVNFLGVEIQSRAP